jgi:hypothetical protein
MQNDLTPKQQTVELIRQAQNILLVTGQQPSHDQFAAVIAMHTVLTRLGKRVDMIVSDSFPRSAELFHTGKVSRDLSGIRDFIIKLRMDDVEVEKLKYQVEGDSLDVIITPHNGNFTPEDASFSYGAYQFDLVIAVGVAQITKLDNILADNPTIFDGLHLINIDYHRINENYGSVNLVDTSATAVCEMLISLFESLDSGMIDEYVATAILTGIMSATANFTAPQTTAKAMTMAAQMVAAGAKQQEVVRVLGSSKTQNSIPPSRPKDSNSDKKTETIAEKLARSTDKTSSESAPKNDAKSDDKAQSNAKETKPEQTEPTDDSATSESKQVEQKLDPTGDETPAAGGIAPMIAPSPLG